MRRLLAVLLLALPAAAGAPLLCPEGNLLREWRFKASEDAAEEYVVARDREAWQELWTRVTGEKSAPAVDFKHEMAVAVLPAAALEIGWVKVTRLVTPGRSRLWVGLCASPSPRGWQVAVTGRSDLEVEFWTKDEKQVVEPGKEPETGGISVPAARVRGASAVWRSRIPALDDSKKAEAKAWIAKLGSEDAGEREAATRGLLRLGPAVRGELEQVTTKDPEVAARIENLESMLPTFLPEAAPETREQALWIAREHLVATHPDQFSNDPQMRWNDSGARFLAGPAWTLTLRYL